MPDCENNVHCPWTNAEKEALWKFKERLSDLDLSKPLFEDRRLINWLRARELRLDDAAVMLRKHLEWREANKIDTILTSGLVPVHEPLLASFPAEVLGHAKDGNSVLIVVSGAMDIKKLIQIYGKETGLNVIYYMLETAYADIVSHSTDPYALKRAYYICDLDNIRFKDYLCSDVLEVLINGLKALEANYPEVLEKAFILNAPFIFPALWNLLKPFLSAATLNKVAIFGSNQEKFQRALLEIISAEELPRRFGGTGFSEKIPCLNAASSSSSTVNISDSKLIKTVIPPGESFEILYEVESPKALLSWTFKTASYDVGFSVLHKPFLIMDGRNGDCTTEKIQYKRYNSQKSIQSGCLVCDLVGQYIIRFDNTYSRMREKTLLYYTDLTQLTPNGNEELIPAIRQTD